MRVIAAVVCLYLFTAPAFAQEKSNGGELRIRAHAGARIYLEGRLAGVSLGEKLGFPIQNVSPGAHTILVRRSGYRPKELTVTVQPATVLDVNMDDLKILRRIKIRPAEEPVDMTASSPPLTIDDTGTPGDGNWEINTSLEGDIARGHAEYEIPRVDINYGLGEDLQLKYEVPLVWLRDEGRTSHGIGNSTLGVKDRFYDDEDSGLSLAVYPQIEFRTPGEKREIAEPTSLLLPLLMTKDFTAASITANVSVEKTSGTGRGDLAAAFGAGTRLSEKIALLAEISALDLASHDRRISVRAAARKKIDENQVVFAAIGTDVNGGDDGLHHRYIVLGYQRFVGQKDH
jgi:hypothetical protein